MSDTITDLTSLTSGQVDRATDVLEIADVTANQSKKITPNALMGISGAAVGDTDSQTLTNKTLTTPTISNPVLSGTVTGTYTIGGTPTFPAAVVTLTGSQTLTNKVLTSPTINTATISNPTLNTDTVNEFTSANGVTVDGLNIKDSKLNTNNSVVTANITDSAVTTVKLATGAGEPGGAWDTWTPSWTNLTVGNGTVVAYYKKVGRTVYFRLTLTWGNTTSISGQVTVSLPVTSATLVARDLIAYGDVFDASATQPYSIRALWATTTTMQCWVDVANATFVSQSALNATQPITWTTSDIFQLTGFYEAAS